MSDAAPFRPFVWLAAAVVPWAVLVGLVLYLPQVLGGLAVAGVVLRRRAPRPVATTPATSVTSAAAPARVRSDEDARTLVGSSV